MTCRMRGERWGKIFHVTVMHYDLTSNNSLGLSRSATLVRSTNNPRCKYPYNHATYLADLAPSSTHLDVLVLNPS